MFNAPGIKLLRHYRRADLRPDLVAGLTVLALLIPSALAFGNLAGVSPVAGLYTGVIAMVLFALFSGSRRLIVGPESQISILIAASLTPMVVTGTSQYASAAAVLALLVGAWTLIGGLIRVGFLADYMSQSVLVGYLTGVALIIGANQLAKLFGGSTGGSTLVLETIGLFTGWEAYDLASAAVGVGSLIVLIGFKRLAPRVPAALIVVVGAIIVSAALDLAGDGVAVVGDVPRGLPLPAVPTIPLDLLINLAAPALGIAVVLFANTVLSARSYAQRAKDPEIDPDQELRALGLANLGAGLWHGFAIGVSNSRTAVAYSLGGRTPLVAITAAVGTVLFLVGLAPLVAPLPQPTLAAVVLMAASSIVRSSDWRRLLEFRRREAAFAAVSLTGVAVFGILPGILLAVAVNLLELISRLSRPQVNALAPTDRTGRWHAVDPGEARQLTPGLLAVRISGPLFFANARRVVTQIRGLLADRSGIDPPVRVLVLNLEGVTLIDLNGAESLNELLDSADEHGFEVRLARVSTDLLDELRRGGILHRLGDGAIYDRVVHAAADVISPPSEEPPPPTEPTSPAEPD